MPEDVRLTAYPGRRSGRVLTDLKTTVRMWT